MEQQINTNIGPGATQNGGQNYKQSMNCEALGALGGISGARGLQDGVLGAAGMFVFRSFGVLGELLGASSAQGGSSGDPQSNLLSTTTSKMTPQRRSERECRNKSKSRAENETKITLKLHLLEGQKQ